MTRKTLTLRLVGIAALWVATALGVAGLMLMMLFESHIERRFDHRLSDNLEELVAASEVDGNGNLRLDWTPADPRFNRPVSGWYWQVRQGDRIAGQSLSLSQVGVLAHAPAAGPRQIMRLSGPVGEEMRALVASVTLPNASDSFSYVIAGPVSDINMDVHSFAQDLAATLTALGVGLVVAVLFQVRFGLMPLRRLRRSLSDIRAGRAEHLPDDFPVEVSPVVDELNALIDHNADLVGRARRQAGNLAHALKNPLTVILQESALVEGERGETLVGQARSMQSSIQRYFGKARIAGPSGNVGPNAQVANVADDICFSMDVLYRGRSLDIRAEGLDELVFRGDAGDLEEMLGNLMDNACKWAHSWVRLSGFVDGERLVLQVEDDGPGIPEQARQDVVERGCRLDERVAGSGYGLDIVGDIAELYRGQFRLEESGPGGLRAVLELPAAAPN